MGYKVQITDFARRELEEIVKYISDILGNPRAAASLLEDFNKQMEYLKDSPYMFSLCPLPGLQQKGYHRFIFNNNYVALYLIDNTPKKKVVTIMHVFYAKRDYQQLI